MPNCAVLSFAALLHAVLYCAQTANMIVKAVLTKSTSQVPMSQVDKYWLDFGTNKYKPYALQGGATDLHMPFVAQVNPLAPSQQHCAPACTFCVNSIVHQLAHSMSTALCTSLHIPCQQHFAQACTFHVNCIVHQLAQSHE